VTLGFGGEPERLLPVGKKIGPVPRAGTKRGEGASGRLAEGPWAPASYASS